MSKKETLEELVHRTIKNLEKHGDIISNNYALILTVLLLLKSEPTPEQIEKHIYQLINTISNET